MPRATMTSKGQITIPRSVRQALRVAAGDQLDFTIEGEGRVVIQPSTLQVGHLKGFLSRFAKRRVSIAQMNAAIARQGRTR